MFKAVGAKDNTRLRLPGYVELSTCCSRDWGRRLGPLSLKPEEGSVVEDCLGVRCLFFHGKVELVQG